MSSKILKAMVVASLATASFAAYADSAPGEQKGDWIVRAGMHQINPKSENLQPVLEGTPLVSTLVVDDALSFTFDVTYMFHNQFGVELLGAYPFTHGIDARPYSGGIARVGETDVLPPTLSLVWRPFAYDAVAQPYIGAGVTYGLFNSTNLRNSFLSAAGLPSGTDLELEDSVGPSAVVGIDLFFDEAKKWFLNANVRWMNIESDAELQVPGVGNVKLGTVEVDPIVAGVMFGRRFGAPAPVVEPPAPPPPPPPPPPPAPTKCADGDMDGVCDEVDKCPNTPAGTKVDKAGCPLEQTLKVLFDFDSAELRPESITELERVVTFMNDVPFATALIEGHTDSIGSEEYNLKLSDRRAKAVYDYLTSRGVDPARLSSIGHGESKPIADNATDEGRQLNRRVMLIRTDSGM
jgi:outer membrane protein OmpA-like peptidoglycan-associated protein